MAKKQSHASPIKTSMGSTRNNSSAFPPTTKSGAAARYPAKHVAKDQISNETDRPPKR